MTKREHNFEILLTAFLTNVQDVLGFTNLTNYEFPSLATEIQNEYIVLPG